MNNGENIRNLRHKKGMTQERLAELLSVSAAAVSKWERGDSYPDITMLFPLAKIFGVTIEMLMGYSNAQSGRSAAVLDAAARTWLDNGTAAQDSFADFGDGYIRIYDKAGMCFAVSEKAYLDECLNCDTEEAAYIMRILADETLLKVLREIPLSKAVTKQELVTKTNLNEEDINRILTGFFKRQMIVCEKDANGKRGYMQAEKMAGVYMILSGCRMLSENNPIGMIRFSRNDKLK